ncbi:MAG: hypothetical protein DRG63_03450 [Deltaproteobacteria bacterium]|nr:MAG: hypothetical protein DRG63_03450 [Deltaproteobacteria bacterium]RLB21999.1 MAG: hypothetical protein DRG76_07725 [Deltaproteobacteria bacterium]
MGPNRLESKLTFWTNVRFRYEYQDNFNMKPYGSPPVIGKTDDSFLLGRLRVGLRYLPMKNLELSQGRDLVRNG